MFAKYLFNKLIKLNRQINYYDFSHTRSYPKNGKRNRQFHYISALYVEAVKLGSFLHLTSNIMHENIY